MVSGDWWYSQNPSIMGRYVQVWKQALSVMLSFELVPYSSTVKNILGILEYMYKVASGVFFCEYETQYQPH